MIKIGRTHSAVDGRLRQLQLGSPVPLVLVGFFRAPNAALAERRAHALWRELREHGEWFHSNDEILSWVSSVSEPRQDELLTGPSGSQAV